MKALFRIVWLGVIPALIIIWVIFGAQIERWLILQEQSRAPAIVTGSKKFTESVILGEIAALKLESEDVPTRHQAELGGTKVVWSALLNGEIDAYPEYTGTLYNVLYADEDIESLEALRVRLGEDGLAMTAPLGFLNNYGVAMTEARAAELGIETISDLREHPGLKLRFNNEFLEREDGWPALREEYDLPHTGVRGIDHDIGYRGLNQGSFDVMEVYETDAEIEFYNLRVLEDDRAFFPDYAALYIYRAELREKHPEAVRALERIAGTIERKEMRSMNRRAKIERIPEPKVAQTFLEREFSVSVTVNIESLTTQMIRLTREHLTLVVPSMLVAMIIAIPLGLIAAKRPEVSQLILGGTGIIQTIPSLALLALLIQPMSFVAQRFDQVSVTSEQSVSDLLGLAGIGAWPAIVALTLYSLLPIVRNTTTGLQSIPGHIRESAQALGMKPFARWRYIELPLASQTIIAGIKTSAVINVGFATLGALIAAGGYGDPILTGLRLDDNALILRGAIPAAGLALVAQGYFEVAERLVVPKGLRLKAAR